MKVSKEEYGLLEEIAREYACAKYDPNKHVTAHDLADRLDMTTKWAGKILRGKYNSGELKREMVKRGNQKPCYGYYRA